MCINLILQMAIIFSSHLGTGNDCVSGNHTHTHTHTHTELLAHLFVVIVGEIFIFPSLPLLEGDSPPSSKYWGLHHRHYTRGKQTNCLPAKLDFMPSRWQ